MVQEKYNETELLEVSEILVNLSEKVLLEYTNKKSTTKYFSNIYYNSIGLPAWGAKGKRSAINVHENYDNKKNSPVTPLSFLASESDEKTEKKTCAKVVKKKSRVELLEQINELVQAKESLIKELEKVKRCYIERKAYNEVLKAKKEELQIRERYQTVELSKSLNLDLGLSHNIPTFPSLHSTEQSYHPHFSKLLQQQFMSQYFSNQTSGAMIDLNILADEVTETDYSEVFGEDKAKAAAARKRRMFRLKERKLNFPPFKRSKFSQHIQI